jgi:Neuraminidase (sialidase)
MRATRRVSVILALCIFLAQTAFANNVQVSNITLTGQNRARDFTLVQFDITWENSWWDPGKHDAAWVFVKYSTDGGGTWNHATLATSGHTAPSVSKWNREWNGKLHQRTASVGVWNRWRG